MVNIIFGAGFTAFGFVAGYIIASANTIKREKAIYKSTMKKILSKLDENSLDKFSQALDKVLKNEQKKSI